MGGGPIHLPESAPVSPLLVPALQTKSRFFLFFFFFSFFFTHGYVKRRNELF